jgi:RNA polymerase sigma-70 factor (ECF subfamily)
MATKAIIYATMQETGGVLDQSNELEASELVIRQHARFVFKVAYGVLRNAHDAEDVVQEVFLRVHRDGISGIRDLHAWLATIAFRLALDRKRRPNPLDVEQLEVPVSEPSAEQSAMVRETLQRVHRLIGSLPDELRHPLLLSAIEELNSRQIAGVLGIPESSVRGRLMRARQLLKEKLAAVTEVKP